MYMTSLRTATVALFLALLTASPALAGPPLITDDAGTVDVGKAEIELNGSSPYDKETTAGVTTKSNESDAEIKISTGLYKNLGISLTIPYTIRGQVKENDQLVRKAEGFGDMTLEIKYAFAEMAGIRYAIKPSIIIPTGKSSAGLSEEQWQFGTTLIATKEFDDGTYALHANAGYEHHNYSNDDIRNTTRSDLWSGSIAGEAKLMKDLTAVVDLGLATTADKSTNRISAYALTGARYEINDHLEINAGVKLGLTKPEVDITVLYGMVIKI
jgi:curved DNA-binding protein CbpA